MNQVEAFKLVKAYILQRRGKHIDMNPRIMTDPRQVEMLNFAVEVALQYYKGYKIII